MSHPLGADSAAVAGRQRRQIHARIRIANYPPGQRLSAGRTMHGSMTGEARHDPDAFFDLADVGMTIRRHIKERGHCLHYGEIHECRGAALNTSCEILDKLRRAVVGWQVMTIAIDDYTQSPALSLQYQSRTHVNGDRDSEPLNGGTGDCVVSDQRIDAEVDSEGSH